MPEILRNLLNGAGGLLTRALVYAFPIINILFILTAAGFGVMLHRRLSRRYRDIVALSLGGILVLTGISQLWDNFFVLENGQLETTGTILVVVALPLGYLFGEALLLDKALGYLGKWLKRLLTGDSIKKQDTAEKKKGKKPPLSQEPMDLLTRQPEGYAPDGFVIATMVCAFGSTAIRCAVESQLESVAAPLLYKMLLDIVIILLLSAIYGSSPTFAVVPVLLTEGFLVLFTRFWGDLITPTILRQICLVGAVIITAAGVKLCLGKRFKIGNLIPALLIPPLYALAMMIVKKLSKAE